MEKKPQPQHQTFKTNTINNNTTTTTTTKTTTNKRAIWDCGSTLYDSFELNSFQKQLDSAIISSSSSSRTLSMPRHLPSDLHRIAALPPPPPQKKKSIIGTSNKLSRSFQKLLRSVFRGTKRGSSSGSEPSYDSNSSSPDPWFLDPPNIVAAQMERDKVDGGRCFVSFDNKPPNGLSTIPEVPEIGLSPEIGPLVRKTMSDRFRAAPLGIYCA